VNDPRAELQALASSLAEASAAAARLAYCWPAKNGPSSAAPTLFSVAQLAAHLGRSRSAVREWCEQGRFGAAAFKLNGRDWRIPAAAVLAFTERQRRPSPRQDAPSAKISPRPATRIHPRRARGGDDMDLGAWRKVRP